MGTVRVIHSGMNVLKFNPIILRNPLKGHWGKPPASWKSDEPCPLDKMVQCERGDKGAQWIGPTEKLRVVFGRTDDKDRKLNGVLYQPQPELDMPAHEWAALKAAYPDDIAYFRAKQILTVYGEAAAA